MYINHVRLNITEDRKDKHTSLVFTKAELIEPNIWIIALKINENNKNHGKQFQKKKGSSGSYWFSSVWSTWECRFQRITDQQEFVTTIKREVQM